MKAYTKLKYLLLATTTLLMTGCDLMHDSRKDCPEGLYIKFVYDYNLHRMDMFSGHVGEVKAYIFDKDGKFVKSQTEVNDNYSQPLAQTDYTMQVTDLEPGEYQVIALCQQRNSEETRIEPGAKYRYTELMPGDDMEKLKASLDKGQWDETRYPDCEEVVSGFLIDHQSAPLDTLWHGWQKETVSIKAQEPSYTKVSLTRNTKKLHISLRQLIEEEASKMDISDYDVYITDRNDVLDYDNEPISNDFVKYTPYAKWNTQDMTRADDEAPKTAHAEVNFNRLIHRSMNDNPAYLQIFNNKTNAMIAKLHLSDVLQQGRGAFEYFNYSAQEFLDREYDFNLSFFLVGDQWKYVELSISTLPWKKRIQNSSI